MNNNHNNALAFSLLTIFVVAVLFFIGNNKSNELSRIQEEKDKQLEIALENIELLAKSVLVYDITDSKKIYGKNENEVLPIASLAKIMTVVEGLRGRDVNDVVEVSPEAVRQAGDFGIFAYEKWRVGDLAKFTLVVSANDGAYALSEQEDNFLGNINSKVRRLGAANTLFANPTGLDVYPASNASSIANAGGREKPIGAGVVASAEDVNTMAIYGLKAHPEIFSATTLPELNLVSESGFQHNFKNTNILVGKIPNLLFSKTGFTGKAGGSLVIIFKDKNSHDIAVTVLGSTFDGRFEDMEKIVDVLSRSD